MSGEFKVARKCIEEAMSTADREPAMTSDAMAGALLNALFSTLLQSRTRKDVTSMIEFQLESCGEDEFVITRGC